jgi:uncharacterized membrane protein YsdA (DUF1294 family)
MFSLVTAFATTNRPALAQSVTAMRDQNEVSGGLLGIGLAFVLALVLISVAVLVFWIWTIIDAAKRPDAEWNLTGQNKTVWVLALVVGGFFGFAFIVSLVYVIWPRPRLKNAAASGVSAQPSMY